MLECQFKTAPPNMSGLWRDLKTTRGYIKRLRKIKGLVDFQIYQTDSTGKIGLYLVFAAIADKYYDYRINEFRGREELVNHDLAIGLSLPLT